MKKYYIISLILILTGSILIGCNNHESYTCEFVVTSSSSLDEIHEKALYGRIKSVADRYGFKYYTQLDNMMLFVKTAKDKPIPEYWGIPGSCGTTSSISYFTDSHGALIYQDDEIKPSEFTQKSKADMEMLYREFYSEAEFKMIEETRHKAWGA